jgi:hypothetical protein
MRFLNLAGRPLGHTLCCEQLCGDTNTPLIVEALRTFRHFARPLWTRKGAHGEPLVAVYLACVSPMVRGHPEPWASLLRKPYRALTLATPFFCTASAEIGDRRRRKEATTAGGCSRVLNVAYPYTCYPSSPTRSGGQAYLGAGWRHLGDFRLGAVGPNRGHVPQRGRPAAAERTDAPVAPRVPELQIEVFGTPQFVRSSVH